MMDTRYITIRKDCMIIQHSRLAKIPRKREIYMEKPVIRSKLYEKICLRVARTQAKYNFIQPKDTVTAIYDGSKESTCLINVLEPYTRKYGIKLVIFGDRDNFTSCFDLENTNSLVGKIAYPLTIDDYCENILAQMFNGEDIKPMKVIEDRKIYPLIKVPRDWIMRFYRETNLDEGIEIIKNTGERELLNKICDLVPNYREMMFSTFEKINLER
ncbi:MAG: hypothetical protein ACE5K4_06225 [Candidatus Hydrothermarchaeota archaeon]